MVAKDKLCELKELAEKAKQDEPVAWIPDKGYENQARFCNAANPHIVIALIAEIERLEKDNEDLRANNYGPEILNDPAALTVSYFAGRMAEGREKNREMDKLLEEKRQLEKEADWLAMQLELRDLIDQKEVPDFPTRKQAEWRKAAREAVEKETSLSDGEDT